MASKHKNKTFQRAKGRIVRQWREGPFFNLGALIALVWSATIFFAIIWGFNLSIMSNDEMMKNAHFFSQGQAWDNYVKAFQSLKVGDENYFKMFWNSIWFSTGATVMKLISTVFFAYVMARYEFPGRKFLYHLVIIQMMLPTYGQTAANYQLLDSFGLVDSPLFLLAMGAGHGMFFLICYSYFQSLPHDYEESARIDGCGYFRTFFQIMIPLAKPAIVTIGLLTFISCWNDYQTTLLYLPHYRTLTSALFRFSEITMHSDVGTLPVYFAGIFLSSLPIVILYICFNKTLMENTTIGGIKA